MTERWKPSVTVAAVASRVEGGRLQYLLVEERTPEGLRLNNPAGHLEPGEAPVDGAVREALEETGCVFVPDCVVGVYLARAPRASDGQDTTYLRLAFGGTVAAPSAPRALDEGIVRVLWMTLDEVRQSRARHRSPLVLQCIEDHAAGRRLPLGAVHTDPTALALQPKAAP